MRTETSECAFSAVSTSIFAFKRAFSAFFEIYKIYSIWNHLLHVWNRTKKLRTKNKYKMLAKFCKLFKNQILLKVASDEMFTEVCRNCERVKVIVGDNFFLRGSMFCPEIFRKNVYCRALPAHVPQNVLEILRNGSKHCLEICQTGPMEFQGHDAIIEFQFSFMLISD